MDAVETMAYVNQVPWHGKGTKLAEGVTAEEMLVASGLDWQVQKYPLMAVLGEDNAIPLEGRYGVVRTYPDGTQDIFPGISVGEKWTPIQNDVGFAVAGLLQKQKELQFDTAGSLHGGKVVWVLARLGKIWIKRAKADDREIDRYVLFTNGHDGKHARHAGLTPVCVVCANTMAMAMQRGLKSEFRIPHTPNAEARAAEADKVLLGITHAYDGFKDVLDGLESRSMSVRQFKAFAKVLLEGMRGTFDEESEERQARETEDNRKKAEAELLHYFGEGLGCRGQTQGDAFQGLCEWIDHEKKKAALSRDTDGWGEGRADRHLASTLMGKNRRIKAGALKLLTG